MGLYITISSLPNFSRNSLREKEVTTTITEQEQSIINKLRLKKNNIDTIRNAENRAAVAINEATDKAAVDAISITWP